MLKTVPAFHDLNHSPTHQFVRGAAVHILSLKGNGPFGDITTLGTQQIGNRLERGGLARAIGAKQGHDTPFHDFERDPFQHEDHMVIDHLNVVDHQQGFAVGFRNGAHGVSPVIMTKTNRLLAIARRYVVLSRVCCRVFLDERAGDIAQRLVELRYDIPLLRLGIPLLYGDLARPFVVFTGDLHRIGKAPQAQLFKPCFVDVKRLETVADMLARDFLGAMNLHRFTDRFGRPHGTDHAPVVQHFPDTVTIALA